MECKCGCGLETEVSGRTVTRRGIRKGDPLSYRRGHAGGAATRNFKITRFHWHEEDRGYDSLCWIWNGTSKNKIGHASVWIGGREFSAHRRMYEQSVGPIPEGLQIDHLCCQPSCVRPEHLEPVTHAENLRRQSKLNWDAVAAIRASPLTNRAAAQEFGVSYGTISDVRRGRTWAE